MVTITLVVQNNYWLPFYTTQRHQITFLTKIYFGQYSKFYILYHLIPKKYT